MKGMNAQTTSARHQLARLLLVMVGIGEPLEPVIDAVAQVVRNALADPLAEIRLPIGEYAAQDGHSDDTKRRYQEPAFLPRRHGLAVLALNVDAIVDRQADELGHRKARRRGGEYA